MYSGPSSERTCCSFCLFLLGLLCVLIDLSVSLEIKIYNDTNLLKRYEDSKAVFEGRSTGIYYQEGQLVFPVPRNACTTVETTKNGYIAFVPNYDICPSVNAEMIEIAGYNMMLSYSPTSETITIDNGATVLINDKDFAKYLDNLLESSLNSITITVTEDYWRFYEKVILIFCLVLMCAISLAICIFLCSFCTRWSCQKWRQRGLTRWQIRQLPQRRYNSTKDTTTTCSICLDDFSDGDKLRVLPCGHVFHPRCVDEWLQKWKRNCPLCKSLISRRTQSEREGNETASLLPANEEITQEYGAVTDTEVGLSSRQRHDREATTLSNVMEQPIENELQS